MMNWPWVAQPHIFSEFYLQCIKHTFTVNVFSKYHIICYCYYVDHIIIQYNPTKSNLSLKMEQIECSKMSAYISQTPGNHPKENKQHTA